MSATSLHPGLSVSYAERTTRAAPGRGHPGLAVPILAFLLPVLAAAGGAWLVRPGWPAEARLMMRNGGPAGEEAERRLILSPAVLHRAVTSLTPGTSTGDDREARLRDALSVAFPAGTGLMRVTAVLPRREDSLHALRAVLDAYLEQRRLLALGDEAPALPASTEGLLAEIRALDTAIRDRSGAAQVLDLPRDIAAAQTRLDGIAGRMSAVRAAQAGTEAALRTARSRLAAQPGLVLTATESTALAPDARLEAGLATLLDRRAAEADPAERQALDDRIAAMHEGMARSRAARMETRSESRNPVATALALRVAELERESRAAGVRLAELERQRTDAAARAAVLRDAEATLGELVRRRDGLEDALRALAEREAAARMAARSAMALPASVTLVQPPVAAAAPEDPRPLLLLAGALSGLLAATLSVRAAGPWGYRSRRDDSGPAGLGLPTLAILPDGAAAAPMRPCRPVIDLATLLLDAVPRDAGVGEAPLTVQFVATHARDGRAAAALLLGVEMAARRGLRVLLVDLEADGRGIPAGMGAAGARPDGEEGRIGAVGTAIPTLWVAHGARGGALGDPRSGRGAAADLLARLRGELDVVLIVAPADRRDPAALRLAPLVDANLLSLRSWGGRQAGIRAVRDAVLAAGGRVPGVVIGGARPFLARRTAWMV